MERLSSLVACMSFSATNSVRARETNRRTGSAKANGEAAANSRKTNEKRGADMNEIAKRMLVLMLFAVFGFCVPGYAAAKNSAVERKAS